jgi:acetyl/propionyl-CoA carboxylase alpha subunit
MTIKKLLIANRGEIVERIIRTCKEKNITSIIIFSENDKNLPYIKKADIAVNIGNNSYLDIDKIVEIAKKYNADSIHPAYGFLSENSMFAKRCFDENITFVGPSHDVIDKMGDKLQSFKIAEKLDIPLIKTFDEKEKITDFPVLIKASLGGGGKGMKVVYSENDFTHNLDSCKRESLASFGSDSVFIQKYFEDSHHIEIQIAGDNYGNYLHFFERECSIQRRYQKILEETPSPYISNNVRSKLIEYSLKIIKYLKYNSVGTIEYLVSNEEVFFLEMNTRLQVEHAITEEVTGIDLVKLQLDIAEGKELNLKQEDINSKGHSIEVRLYAEDVNKDFKPSIGRLLEYSFPNEKNIRLENTFEKGLEVTPFYDPMMCKVISYGNNRNQSISTLKEYLKKVDILGVETNKSLLIDILEDENFKDGSYNTSFIKNKIEYLNKMNQDNLTNFLIASTMVFISNRIKSRNIFKHINSWSNTLKDFKTQLLEIDNNSYEIKYKKSSENNFDITILDNLYDVELVHINDTEVSLIINDLRFTFKFSVDESNIFITDKKETFSIKEGNRFPKSKSEDEYKEKYFASLPGEISKLYVKVGDTIKVNSPLLVINSMKMENTINALSDCVIEEIFVQENTFVKADSLMLKVKPL